MADLIEALGSYFPTLIGITLGFIVALVTLRFLTSYQKARKQFPGPPIKNFWTGNLDQTLADNVHEKVRSSSAGTWRTSSIATNIWPSGDTGMIHMVQCTRLGMVRSRGQSMLEVPLSFPLLPIAIGQRLLLSMKVSSH